MMPRLLLLIAPRYFARHAIRSASYDYYAYARYAAALMLMYDDIDYCCHMISARGAAPCRDRLRHTSGALRATLPRYA